jgi:ribosomal protein L37AE/L43A
MGNLRGFKIKKEEVIIPQENAPFCPECRSQTWRIPNGIWELECIECRHKEPLGGGHLRQVKRRLTFEFIPLQFRGKNARTLLPRATWDKIRKKVQKDANYLCQACGGGSGGWQDLHCHEVWEYDDTKHTSTLVGFLALCNTCHNVKHCYLGKEFENDRSVFRFFREQYCRINNCSENDYFIEVGLAEKDFERRSQNIHWDLIIPPKLIAKFTEEENNGNQSSV